MQRENHTTHLSTQAFVEKMLEHLPRFRYHNNGILEANMLLLQRPATHRKIFKFLIEPDWFSLEYEVSHACWNSSEFGPSAMSHVLSRLQRFVLFFEVWFCYCLIGIFVRAVA